MKSLKVLCYSLSFFSLSIAAQPSLEHISDQSKLKQPMHEIKMIREYDHKTKGIDKLLFSIGYPLCCLNLYNILSPHEFNVPIDLSAIFVSYVLADFWSGLVHWITDNFNKEEANIYSKETPTVIDNILSQFLDNHHVYPWKAGERDFIKNIAAFSCVGVLIMNIGYIIPSPISELYALSIFFLVHSQQMHKYQHLDDSRKSAFINFLQRIHVIESKKNHNIHHYGDKEKGVEKYTSKYTSISGLSDPVSNELFTPENARKTKKIVSCISNKINNFFSNLYQKCVKLRIKTGMPNIT